MKIAVAGPYSAESEQQKQEHLDKMNAAAVNILKMGHIPLIGINAALPMLKFLPEEERYEAIMKISLELVNCCDAILVLGSSPGANKERSLIENKNLPVYFSLSEIPLVNSDQ